MAARWMIWALMALGVAWAGAAAASAAEPAMAPAKVDATKTDATAAAEPVPAVELPPDALQTLGLTDLQRRVLDQVFRRHAYEMPTTSDAELSAGVAPVAGGGLYRMGPVGDLPATLVVTVSSKTEREPIQVSWMAQDFYGRKVGGAKLPPIFPDAAGLATAFAIGAAGLATGTRSATTMCS